MGHFLSGAVCGTMEATSLPAQTERRGGAGPVGGLLGGKDPTGRSEQGNVRLKKGRLGGC